MAEYKYLKLEKPDSGIALIRFLKTKKYVIFSTALIKELVECLKEQDADEGIRVIVVTGDEDAFSVGADITEMKDKKALDVHKYERGKLWQEIRKIEKPIICAVSGYCFGGGCEIVLMSDIVIASDTAQFSQPEINLGFIPGAGGTVGWSKLCGKFIASEILMTGRMVTATEAQQLKLINKIVPKEKFLQEAIEMAKLISSKSPYAIKFIKKLVQKAQDLPTDVCSEFERRYFELLFDTKETQELINKFLQR